MPQEQQGKPTLEQALEAARDELISVAQHAPHAQTYEANFALAAQAYAVATIEAMVPAKAAGPTAAELEDRTFDLAVVNAADDLITAVERAADLTGLTREHFAGLFEPLLEPLLELAAAVADARGQVKMAL